LALSNATFALRLAIVPIGTVTVGVVAVTEIGAMVTAALADLVESVIEVAVIVTVPLAGIAAGAVYVICPPLAVSVAIGSPDWSEPQLALPQVRVHFKPAATLSFVAVALSRAVPLVPNIAGGGVGIATVIGSGATVSTALVEIEGLLVALAVIVTELPTGM
jgi:hypothetical protein